MSARNFGPDRRAVLVGGGLAGGGVAVPAQAAARLAAQRPPFALFDPGAPGAQAFAAAVRRAGGDAAAVEGDRVRLARRLFGELRPSRVVALTRYADAVLLAGGAEEEGYRHAAAMGRVAVDGDLYAWSVALRRG